MEFIQKKESDWMMVLQRQQTIYVFFIIAFVYFS